jgi:hypothetical protein
MSCRSGYSMMFGYIVRRVSLLGSGVMGLSLLWEGVWVHDGGETTT